MIRRAARGLALPVLMVALAIGLVRARTRWSPAANVLMLIPLVTPEIVAGVSSIASREPKRISVIAMVSRAFTPDTTLPM